jgi:hypothetical protein
VPFSSGHPGAWRTDETRPPLGIWSSEGAEPEVQLSYRVDDIAATVERVRAAGGHADEPERKPYGLIAECVDDQGGRSASGSRSTDRSARTRRTPAAGSDRRPGPVGHRGGGAKRGRHSASRVMRRR